MFALKKIKGAKVMKRFRNLLLAVSLILGLVLLAGCNQNSGQKSPQNTNESAVKTQTLVVGAAASLNEAFTELGQLFESNNPNWKVEFSFASSGNLKTSIEQGAPIDVFASAAEKQMDDLRETGHIDGNTVQLMLKNQLVLIVPESSEVKSLEELLNLRRIAIAEPSSAPVGQYAKQSLTNLGYWSRLEDKLILAKDVRQVLFYVEQNEVDAGFVYATDAAKSGIVKVVTAMPEDSYPTALYPIGIVSSTKQKAIAEKWIEFVLSEEGQRVLSAYGFEKP